MELYGHSIHVHIGDEAQKVEVRRHPTVETILSVEFGGGGGVTVTLSGSPEAQLATLRNLAVSLADAILALMPDAALRQVAEAAGVPA